MSRRYFGLIIIGIILLVFVGLVLDQGKVSTGLISPIKQVTFTKANSPTTIPTPTFTPTPTPIPEVHYNAQTDLLIELEKVNPVVLDSDFKNI